MTAGTLDAKANNAKELVKMVLQSLPDNASLDEILDAIEVQGIIQRGLRESQEGHVLTESEARARLSKWLK